MLPVFVCVCVCRLCVCVCVCLGGLFTGLVFASKLNKALCVGMGVCLKSAQQSATRIMVQNNPL